MNNKGITCDSVEVDASSAKIFRRAVTDPLRYKQIVLNLMTNAVKFTALQPGRKRIHVSLVAERSANDGDQFVLSCKVRDTAKGMSPEAIDRIFGKFYQVSSRTHVEYGGSGLGLFISQRLATLLGGKIHVSSELGIGSCFTFEMPTQLAITEPRCSCGQHLPSTTSEGISARELQQTMESLANAIPAPEPGRHARNRSSSNSSYISNSPTRARKSTTPPTIPGSPLVGQADVNKSVATQAHPQKAEAAAPDLPNTVLVIEDNLINQRLLVKQLQMAGYNVLVGNHGLEALQHFKDGRKIDLVVTDIEMPVMNGMETIAAVRALENAVHQPPFIACSAYAREEQRQAFLDAGMIDVLAKPFKFAELKLRVEHVLKYRLPFRREYTV
jgi:CheY-like chemotaxis protein